MQRTSGKPQTPGIWPDAAGTRTAWNKPMQTISCNRWEAAIDFQSAGLCGGHCTTTGLHWKSPRVWQSPIITKTIPQHVGQTWHICSPCLATSQPHSADSIFSLSCANWTTRTKERKRFCKCLVNVVQVLQVYFIYVLLSMFAFTSAMLLLCLCLLVWGWFCVACCLSAVAVLLCIWYLCCSLSVLLWVLVRSDKV